MAYDLELIRKQVPMPRILAHYGLPADKNFLCLWHNDKEKPSCQPFSDGCYCYTCRKQYDIFDVVRVKEHINFWQAVDWIIAHAGILPEKVYAKSNSDYIGPVPAGWIKHWHENLPDHARDYYHGRLLTDETIDLYQLGWRADYSAYTIPFWQGIPGQSEIDTLQYRASGRKPTDRKYWGEKGYVKPSVLNMHLLFEPIPFAIFPIGSFDGLLGAQDGLPMFGINGAAVFSDPKRAESVWLRRSFEHVEHKYVIPDATHTEFEAAHRIAHILGAEVRYFPRSLNVKDYNDFRLAGYTPQYFIEEIIMATSNGYTFGISESNIIKISDILGLISKGKVDQALAIHAQIAEKYPHSGNMMAHSFQQMCNRRPLHYDPATITDAEWDVMCTDFSNAQTYKKQEVVIRFWCEVAESRMGSF